MIWPFNKPKPLMETTTKMPDIQTNVKQAAVRAIAAYDRAIAKINSLDAEVASLTATILELQDLLDAKFPADVGGSVGGIVE